MAGGKLHRNIWQDVPITYTTTTGDINDGSITVSVNDEFIFFNFVNMNRAAQTATGANMYAANITGTPDFYSGMFCAYNGSSAIIVAVWNDGNGACHVEARVTGAALAANSKVTARGILRLG